MHETCDSASIVHAPLLRKMVRGKKPWCQEQESVSMIIQMVRKYRTDRKLRPKACMLRQGFVLSLKQASLI
jgi:hypothetical protein